jgi:hypothetical protein
MVTEKVLENPPLLSLSGWILCHRHNKTIHVDLDVLGGKTDSSKQLLSSKMYRDLISLFIVSPAMQITGTR